VKRQQRAAADYRAILRRSRPWRVPTVAAWQARDQQTSAHRADPAEAVAAHAAMEAARHLQPLGDRVAGQRHQGHRTPVMESDPRSRWFPRCQDAHSSAHRDLLVPSRRRPDGDGQRLLRRVRQHHPEGLQAPPAGQFRHAARGGWSFRPDVNGPRTRHRYATETPEKGGNKQEQQGTKGQEKQRSRICSARLHREGLRFESVAAHHYLVGTSR
jgi:hypothetical protein